MDIIHTVRLHRTKGYPMDAVWYHVDPDTNVRGPDIEVSAERVFERLQQGYPVVVQLSRCDVTCPCRPVTLDHGIRTFELDAPPDEPGTTIRRVRQLVPYGADSD